MTRVDFTIFCDGCGTEILGLPIARGKHDFCCQDCLQGFRCECCSWYSLNDDERRSDEISEDPLIDTESPLA